MKKYVILHSLSRMKARSGATDERARKRRQKLNAVKIAIKICEV